MSAAPQEVIIEISPDAVYEVLDGEAVVLNLSTGDYYRLNAVGTRMWELIDEHRDLRRVRTAMLDEFDVADDVLDRDLAALIGDLTDMGLLSQS